MSIPHETLGKLRTALSAFRQSDHWKDIVDPGPAVIRQFSQIFDPDRLDDLTAEEFKEFLLDRNNRHWSGLHRLGSKCCRDMNTLRNALKLLLDESKPIADRLSQAVGMIHGMGKNIATAILLVCYPDKYGVWNSTSEAALKKLDLWPKFEWGQSFGERYVCVNQVFLEPIPKLF